MMKTQQSRNERGSILLIAVMVILFFSSFAVFLQGMTESMTNVSGSDVTKNVRLMIDAEALGDSCAGLAQGVLVQNALKHPNGKAWGWWKKHADDGLPTVEYMNNTFEIKRPDGKMETCTMTSDFTIKGVASDDKKVFHFTKKNVEWKVELPYGNKTETAYVYRDIDFYINVGG